VFCDTI